MLVSAPPVIITPGLEQEDGWIIIQRRINASVSFERSWDEYAAGFGDVDGNFWLGLEAIHNLTAAQPMSLQIDIVPFNISAVSIPYQQIQVGDAASEYLLTITSNTSGHTSLYTSLNFHSGCKFSTSDNDNDEKPNTNCAEFHRAGWWFSNCVSMHLNGVYGIATRRTQLHVYMHAYFLSSDTYEPIRTVTMKIRAIN